MTRAELLALAERVEKAEGPDRELDYAILRVLKPEYAGSEWQPYADGLRHVNDSSDARTLPARETCPQQWTSSLDAAASLMPEGWECALYWGVNNFASEAQLERHDRHKTFAEPTTGTAATPTLALCAAVLRALAGGSGDE